MRVISIINNKGGVGKTTTAINVSSILAEKAKTLLVDIDGQANATRGIGFNPYELEMSIYNVLCKGASVKTVIQQTNYPNLDLLPSNIKLQEGERELLATTGGGITKLKRAIGNLNGEYEYVIIDNPPNPGVLSQNSILASTDIIIPMDPEHYAIQGITILNKMIADMKEEMNHHVNLLGVLITRAIPQQNLHQTLIEEIKRYFGSAVFSTIIRKNVAIGESTGEGKPVHVYEPKSKGSLEYRQLVKEILSLLKNVKVKKRKN